MALLSSLLILSLRITPAGGTSAAPPTGSIVDAVPTDRALSAGTGILQSLAALPEERSLDAGTWVRQSLTVIPAVVQDCPSYETFERRAWGRLSAEVLAVLRPQARSEAREEKLFCDEARSALIARLRGDWSRLTAMERFDRNDLPAPMVQTLSTAYLNQPDSLFKGTLVQIAADSLRSVVAVKALERSAHLQSDQQQNSAVATKMRTQDVTVEELGLLRGSAHVLAMRVTNLDVSRRSEKAGMNFRVTYQTAIWSFDPVAKTFTTEASFKSSEDETSKSGSSAGASVADEGYKFTDKFLDLKPFHFTTQILSGNEGSWLRPASKFGTNTKADLNIHRRFRYIETRAVTGGSDKQVAAGYGYIDSRFTTDSAYRLRHIGGIRPYSGLVLEEVPGNGWASFSLSWVNSYIDGAADTTKPDRSSRFVSITHTSPVAELRLGVRSNLGNFANNHFLLDVPLYLGSVTGSMNQNWKTTGSGNQTLRLRAEKPTSMLIGLGLEPGWCFRFPIRRLFFTGGVQAGLRFNMISLDDERIVDQYGINHTSDYNKSELPLTKLAVGELLNIDGTLSVRGGLQWSFTPWIGMGAEVMYDVLRGEGGNSYHKGSIDNTDLTDIPGPTTGQGRLRFLLQFVWK